jgi:hypothetical protein
MLENAGGTPYLAMQALFRERCKQRWLGSSDLRAAQLYKKYMLTKHESIKRRW